MRPLKERDVVDQATRQLREVARICAATGEVASLRLTDSSMRQCGERLSRRSRI
jgi:hypothetical protein